MSVVDKNQILQNLRVCSDPMRGLESSKQGTWVHLQRSVKSFLTGGFTALVLANNLLVVAVFPLQNLQQSCQGTS